MNEESLSAIEIYMNRVFKFVILVYPAASLYSGLTYSTIKLLGFYQNVSWFNMLFFDITCLIYFLVGLHFFLTCETAEGYLKPNVMRHGKIFLAITELTMWNLITYLLPHKEFWGYAAIFIMFVVFLLDHKFTLIVSAEIMISAVVSWFVRGDFLLPARDELFVPNIILREEILVMVRADNEVTKQVAERIRHDIENEKITYNNKNVGITVTIGVASYKPNATVDELIKLADDKLYIGKNNGKNQVVSA